MLKRTWLMVGLTFTAAQVAASAPAAIVFDMMGAQGPFVDTSQPGSANTTDTINNNGVIINNADGFTVMNFSVTYTADAAGAAGGLYRWSVGFHDTVAEMVKVTVIGNTDVTESAGATGAKLTTPGNVTDGMNAVIIMVASSQNIANGANATNYQWNDSHTGNLAANTDYILSLFTGVTFQAAAAGDKITTASTYTIRIQSVPEPSSGLMAILGLGGLGLGFGLRRWGRRTGGPSGVGRALAASGTGGQATSAPGW